MRNIRDIIINKAIIHIVDNNMDEPILNQSELILTDETLEFIGKHIAKASSDEEAKFGKFINESAENIYRKAIYDDAYFNEASYDITRNFFDVCKKTGMIPSGDLVIVKFECEYGKSLAIISLIYNKTYIHDINYEEEKMLIEIKPQYIGLPDTSQKLQKCAIINFENETSDILILNRPTKLEKELKNNSAFINEIMKCELVDDKRDNTKAIIKASENWVRENLNEDAGKAESVRREIGNILRNEESLNIEEVAMSVLEDKTLAESYVNELKEAGVTTKNVELDKEWVEKKLKRKKLKIDKDMEIYINAEVYNDANRFQIKRNGDGTIDIIIRQVRNYLEK